MKGFRNVACVLLTLLWASNAVTYFRYNQVAYGLNNQKVVLALRNSPLKASAFYFLEDANGLISLSFNVRKHHLRSRGECEVLRRLEQ